MRRDVRLAAMVNLRTHDTKDDPEIQDLYEIVAHHAQQDLFADEPSRSWLDRRGALRDLAIRPIMTLPYGVTPRGMLDQIKATYDEMGMDASFDGMVRLRVYIWRAIEV